MKTAVKFIFSTCLSVAALFSTAFCQFEDRNEINQKSARKTNVEGFALVELFTSEGCSSCPPADALVAKVQQEYAGKPVYILAFHVDYWDHQGWKDVFSNPDFTTRQYQYASWLRTESVYTPQIVVNGKKQFVGSEKSSLNNALTAGLQSQPSASLAIKASQDRGKISVDYQAGGAGKNTVLQLALVQKIAHTTVQRGENAGRLLPHVQIVHQIQSQSIQAGGSGQAELSVPDGFNVNGWELIGFTQNKKNGTVLAAARSGFKENI